MIICYVHKYQQSISMKSLCSSNFYNHVNNWVIQMHPMIGGVRAVRCLMALLDLYRFTRSHARNIRHVFMAVMGQQILKALGGYWFEEYNRQNFLKLLVHYLQNVQIQPGQECAIQYKIIVPNDQYYVCIKLKEDEMIFRICRHSRRHVVFLWQPQNG